MRKCIHNHCYNTNIEWEHCFIYAGRQIDEAWAIVPCCKFHHRGLGLDKHYNRYVSILRCKMLGKWDDTLRKYPRLDWVQLDKYLTMKYA